ncbi:MAG: hypothetical protein K0R57_2170 [Paenibacillaceae bacterium]|nr:hypothetical protein [Paenibacillaceae bacterium]
MDLSRNSEESIAYMIDAIKTKLRVASGAAIRADFVNPDLFEDLKDIYELVASKERFSVSEIDAIVSELGKLRKS